MRICCCETKLGVTDFYFSLSLPLCCLPKKRDEKEKKRVNTLSFMAAQGEHYFFSSFSNVKFHIEVMPFKQCIRRKEKACK